MKLFLSSLIFSLLSCTVVPTEKAGEEVEKSEVKSIRAQARTALKEVEAFQTEVQSIRSILVSRNAGNPSSSLNDKLKTIASLESSLGSLIVSADQAFDVVKAAVDQAESAVNEAEVEQAIRQAISAKDNVVSARNQAEEIRNRVKTIADG